MPVFLRELLYHSSRQSCRVFYCVDVQSRNYLRIILHHWSLSKSPYTQISFLTGQNIFVFKESTTVDGIPLNDEKFGMLYENHINVVRKLLFAGSTMNNTLYMKYESQN